MRAEVRADHTKAARVDSARLLVSTAHHSYRRALELVRGCDCDCDCRLCTVRNGLAVRRERT